MFVNRNILIADFSLPGRLWNSNVLLYLLSFVYLGYFSHQFLAFFMITEQILLYFAKYVMTVVPYESRTVKNGCTFTDFMLTTISTLGKKVDIQ